LGLGASTFANTIGPRITNCVVGEQKAHGQRLYVPSIVDVFSRRIVDWQLASHTRATLVFDYAVRDSSDPEDAYARFFHSRSGVRI
jgi:hypothetical protein